MAGALTLATVLATLTMHPADDLRTGQPLFCLAANVYWEARGEPLEGQLAVANVTRNRVMEGRWPDRFCEVVSENAQFSWVKKRRQLRKRPVDENAWGAAVAVAILVLADMAPDQTKGATHYCNPAITRAKWCHEGFTVAQIGGHKFTIAE